MSAFVRSLACALAAAAIAGSPAAAAPTPLFASDAAIHVTIQGPVGLVSRNAAKGPQDATLAVEGPDPERLAIRISARGITRLKRDVCQFAPLRVEFTVPPGASSLFAGQKRLKLVTHCRANPGFQQSVLLEYSAYELFNLMTPASYRVRLATVDYVEPDGRPLVSRLGFFLEDTADVARRNDLAAVHTVGPIPIEQLSARDAARVAMFEYMISNYDWSLRMGAPGNECCHNAYPMVHIQRGDHPGPVRLRFFRSGRCALRRSAGHRGDPERYRAALSRLLQAQQRCARRGRGISCEATGAAGGVFSDPGYER